MAGGGSMSIGDLITAMRVWTGKKEKNSWIIRQSQ